MSEIILECRGLNKSYKGFPALHNIELALPKGSIIGLLGPNGSGKTTFIKLVSGLLTPDSGSITIDDIPVGSETKKIVSYLPDHNFLTPWMTVEQMITYFSDFFADFRTDKATAMLKNLGIDKRRQIKTLSKGNQEKVALILAMSREAKLYLLDEPIAGVDPATRDYILNTIIGNYSENSTVIISTHLIADIEQILSDVIFISSGQVILGDSVDNIRQKEGKSIDMLFREVFRC